MIANTPTLQIIIDRIKEKQNAIHTWLESYEQGSQELPLYSSVDIRDSGFKMAVVDTNIFPAGFNNLCEHGLADSTCFIRQAIEHRLPSGDNILIVAEEHTRNTWYLENIRILEEIIQRAGYHVKIVTFLTVHPSFCESTKFIQLETATGHPVKIHCFKSVLDDYQAGRAHFDLIILNNDLTNGIPDILKNADVPIYPSIQAGWHSRLKSHHFSHTVDLMNEFAALLDIDPWIFSCLFHTADHVNINSDEDRQTLKQQAGQLLEQIQIKYQQHNIQEKPYIVLKSDSGTYGMGVMTIEEPEEILNLNRKNRNKLYKGKGARVIDRYILQEGVPTMHNLNQKVSEVCIYQIENNLVGGFYRSHSAKTSRENLNAQGVVFNTMCPHLSKYGDCGIHHNINVFDVYRILARIAGIAAHREIVQLEKA